MADLVKDIALKIATGIATKGAGQVLGIVVTAIIGESTTPPAYFETVYTQIQSIVSTQLAKDKVNEITGLTWATAVRIDRYQQAKSKGQANAAELEAIENRLLDSLGLLRQEAYAIAGLPQFLIIAGMHLAILLEREAADTEILLNQYIDHVTRHYEKLVAARKTAFSTSEKEERAGQGMDTMTWYRLRWDDAITKQFREFNAYGVAELVAKRHERDYDLSDHRRAVLEELRVNLGRPDQVVEQWKYTTLPAKRLSGIELIQNKTGLEMIHIPAGDFLFGPDSRRQALPEFWISKTPVTKAHYMRYIVASGKSVPWKKGVIPKGEENFPMDVNNWKSALAYCDWASEATGQNLRLPTEMEWEKAARGTDGRVYPWGNEYLLEHCNLQEFHMRGEHFEKGNTIKAVTHFSPQGDSPYGCVDMLGNLSEWTSTVEPNPKSPNNRRRDLIILKGMYLDYAPGIRGHMPYLWHRLTTEVSSPSASYSGFRVVLSR